MLFSQIALLVLIVMGIVTGYLPLWLGLATIAAWGAAKLAIRPIVARIERAELERRPPSFRFEVHSVRAASDEELPLLKPAEKGYIVEATLHAPTAAAACYPIELEVHALARGAEPVRGSMDEVMVWGGDDYTLDGCEQFRGSQRIRLLLTVPADATECLVRYREERIAQFALPGL